ncbi:hypothetical protein SAMN04515624_103225 [Eubacterium maltosivorans]|uniref:Uncharacterized protein n=2 Tax=Eubacterium maltosivorans TaxID=2041044 RepID=A0A4V1GMH4_EUBML|nr:hypothetical protein CPZ25_018905 [Eubacterium maltosivorans]WPK81146.1 hypothetical protein EUMA32_25750 [Eubacterium maltosivorans]SDO68897.1 hypothetical protein SAMN04515624_103225 [Eubacterium maltosivorans]
MSRKYYLYFFMIIIVINISVWKAMKEIIFLNQNDFITLLKICFLAEEANNNISIILLYILLFLLILLYLITKIYDISNKYRSMILARFGNRKSFICFYQIQGLKNSFFIVIMVFILFFLFYFIKKKSFYIDYEQIVNISILVINYFLFLNFCISLNIFLSFLWNETLAPFLVIVMSLGFILLDIALADTSFITYIENKNFSGSIVLFLLLVSINTLTYFGIQKRDIL